MLIANDWRIDPMPVVIGAAQYPEHILEDLAKEHKSVYSECDRGSKKAWQSESV